MVVCKPMIVGAFDMMESLVMMPSSLGAMESYVIALNSMQSILFKYYMISLKESLKPLHVVAWVLKHGDVWSYFWLYGYWDVDGGISHRHALIC